MLKQVAIASFMLVLLHIHYLQPTIKRVPLGAAISTNRTNLDYLQPMATAASHLPGQLSQLEDLPVSGWSWPSVSNRGAELESGGKLSNWLKRKAAGQQYFEIPDYPLDDPRNLADGGAKITHLDADLRACLGQVRDQGSCGSCYAFAWNALAEWHYCIQTGKLIDFSEQHMIDCGDERRLQGGCITGSLKEAHKFTDQHGFHLESDYPYRAKKSKSCKGLEGSVEVKTRDFTRIKVDRDEWEQVLKEQPILVSTRLPFDIQDYQRGIHPADNCQESFRHGMLLVGYGRDQGQPYWLLRNSSGPKWGENGYLRLTRDLADMSKCFATAFVAKFRFKQLDEEDYYNFQPQFEPSRAAEPSMALAGLKANKLGSKLLARR